MLGRRMGEVGWDKKLKVDDGMEVGCVTSTRA